MNGFINVTRDRPKNKHKRTHTHCGKITKTAICSELAASPHAAQAEGPREQALWYSTRTFRCRQLQFVGFSVNLADVFVFAGTNWENPVSESGTKILTV